MNWDDLKLLLAVGRQGSVSGASRILRLHRATVLRRFDAMEARLGAQLADRTPEGYRLTAAGSEFFAAAERVEADILAAEARIAGEDARVEGVIRVTMPEPLARWVVAPSLHEFQRRYPGLTLEILATMDLMDLARRDADIALRFTEDPPETLVGRRFGRMTQTAYATPDLRAALPGLRPVPVIGWGGGEAPWAEGAPWDESELVGGSAEISVQQAMARTGAGVACLPCFTGDQDPALERVMDRLVETPHEIWLLTHPDLRRQARVGAAMEFLGRLLSDARPLFMGEAARR